MSTNLTTLAQQNVTSNLTNDYKGRIIPTYPTLILPNNEILYQTYLGNNASSLENTSYCYGKECNPKIYLRNI